MKEITSRFSGSIAPLAHTPCMIPVFANGGAYATQSGNIITVTCANPHNIPMASSSNISNNNVSIILWFGYDTTNNNTSAIKSNCYKNIIVISTTQFTCVSDVSQEITDHNIIALEPWIPLRLIDVGIDIPANYLTAGSSIIYETFLERPNLGIRRTSSYAFGPISLYSKSMYNDTSQWNNFGNDSLSSSTAISRHIYKHIYFYGDKQFNGGYNFVDREYSAWNSSRYSPGQSDSIGNNIASEVRAISLKYGFTFSPFVNFDLLSAECTATISGNTMTVSIISSGTLTKGQTISGIGITAGTIITGFVPSGINTVDGEKGTYTISPNHNIATATSISAKTLINDYLLLRMPRLEII